MSRLGETFSVIVAIALVGTAVWYGIRPTEAPVVFAGPTAAELDSLSRYLAPVSPAPPVDDYDMFVPASEPIVARAAPPPAPAPQTPYRLSAILVVADRPLAIIDDQQVRAGTVLPGGSEVLAIESTQVHLRDPDGSRRTLRLANSGRIGEYD